MTVSWVVVTNRSGARFFEHRGVGSGLELVRELEHPKGRLKDLDYNSDHPGRAFDSHGEGRHSYAREHSPSDQETHLFVKEVASLLGEERVKSSFERLVLVAGPGILGLLRDELDATTGKLVSATVDKNLLHADAQELASHLEGYLPV